MRILITGGAGFLGAWIVRRLAPGGHALRIFDLAENRGLIAAIAGERAADACEWRVGDIAARAEIRRAAADCDAIVHLAGVLTLACRADPVRGAEINLLGTLNVFEAARDHGISRIVYTSSAAVYGPFDGRAPWPTSHYGAFKLACEGCVRAYWEDHRLASIGFRPYVVYGPGREGGLTAGPSSACRAAAEGAAYVFPYRGSAGLVYVDDVAAAFEAALAREPDGAHVFNLVGEVASPEQVIAELHRLAPNTDIRTGGDILPFAPEIAEGNVREAFPNLPATSLRSGIERTFTYYRDGRL